MHEPLDADTLRERRQANRRTRTRRRRLLILAAVVVVAAAAAVAVTLGSGGGGSGSGGSPAGGDGARAGASGKRAASAGGGAGSSRAAGTSTVAAHASGRPGDASVPVLMYHVIAPPPAGAPFPGLYVPPSEFSEQMHALAAAGWHAVTLDQLAANWREGAPLGDKPVVVSFDNGYHSQYSQALPVLRSLGWVGDENIQLTGLPPSQGGLSSTEVQGLIAAGWELDTQGLSHADLITLGPAALREQVQETRQELRHRYHVPVNWFCYPSGHYDAAVIAAVRAAGYSGSTTVVPGWAHRTEDAYRTHRLRVLGGTSGPQLLALIEDTRADPPAPDSYGG